MLSLERFCVSYQLLFKKGKGEGRWGKGGGFFFFFFFRVRFCLVKNGRRGREGEEMVEGRRGKWEKEEGWEKAREKEKGWGEGVRGRERTRRRGRRGERERTSESWE